MKLVIGVGNTLRHDDGAGIEVATRLKRLAARRPDVQVLTAMQLTPELAEPVSRADFVVVVDASTLGEPGDVMQQALYPAGPARALTHHVAPEMLLTLARHLYGHSPPAMLITITGAHFEAGEGLSPVVEGAMPEVLGFLLRLLFTGPLPPAG
ncbi:MAG: hydrogenase maturation protease [Anaerolineae bacterium]|nr:hydrogenase maturation protease [Anaerolineae bacterium]